ncbi:PucR family transcriptional regulator [Paenibacillus radicis (ex Xue et al. 2023)]|uniref:PucR family transcriptional regulator ligand-binding domain-containing protein n=1 Tax=Paenibacillus radicis (ex Xue et al. 2023) TaxID=2972489 RepID=A0ABT1YPN7_9BACL|nr:PucR family transcriptional regulator [Paenibacillus radicis (ex Xue et al. 2023)]MCR8635138.1 PucR family transcriptional regulator ligand-binding domain-containing protein [Paenibacillus radicis (ex Xue et al. 2023)]
MGVSVKEAMQIGGLVQCKVVAGEKGLHRTIDYITVMEVPDVIRWLKGNDLLLTSLYPIKDDPEAIGHLVQQLHDVGSSALAIKTERYVKEIPEVIIEAGNRLGFPIIEIEDEVSYLDIMTPLMELRLNKSDLGKEQLEKFFQWITELAMGGKGIPSLVEAVQQMTENIITVGSEVPALEGISWGKTVAALTRAQKNELKIAKRSIRMERMLDHQSTPCIVTPLFLNDELYGDVTCWQTKREFVERDFLVLDRTVLLMALEFLKVITRADVEQTFKDDFLSEVLTGNVADKAEVIEKGKMFNWNLSKDYQVFAIAYSSSPQPVVKRENEALWFQERKRKLLLKVNDIFRFDAQKAIITVRKELIVVLYHREPAVGAGTLPYTNDPHNSSIMDLAESARRQLSQEFDELSFTVGVGRFYQGLEGIHQGYKEAVKAIQLGKPISGKTGCVHYEDLGIFRVLGQVNDWKEMEDIYSETIGKLVEYDWSSNASLVVTLREYFANNCSLAETAEKLFVHVNTMKYRLQKIEQLTGCSVHDAEKRLLLHMGLKIDQILQSGNV